MAILMPFFRGVEQPKGNVTQGGGVQGCFRTKALRRRHADSCSMLSAPCPLIVVHSVMFCLVPAPLLSALFSLLSATIIDSCLPVRTPKPHTSTHALSLASALQKPPES
jgi:hypothetical protein